MKSAVSDEVHGLQKAVLFFFFFYQVLGKEDKDTGNRKKINHLSFPL